MNLPFIFVVFRCSSKVDKQLQNSTNQTDNLTRTEYDHCLEIKYHNKSVTKVPCQNGWSFDLEERQSTIVNEVVIEIFAIKH